MKEKVSLFWHRRDLRIPDNAGLYHALKHGKNRVLPIFIFDRNILDDLKAKDDARVTFIYDALQSLKNSYEAYGSSLKIYHGRPKQIWKGILQEYDVQSVYTNRDYEPYAKERDSMVREMLAKENIDFLSYKDHVIFESSEIRKGDGEPYVVFTPYKRSWLRKLEEKRINSYSYFLTSYPTTKYLGKLWQGDPLSGPTLTDMKFRRSSVKFPPREVKRSIVKNYDQKRDYPAVAGTTRLGIHFRFGTISIREKARKARQLNDTFLSELIWRDFYSQILDFFPRVVDEPFREKYARIPWRTDDDEFKKWCQGITGYPLVDAGIRELNHTGYMHNRVRMVVASFLTKHLLMDWRRGEAYFAEKLLDYDLASNNGGWQWAAGCGTDAAPYFRIFNPSSQQKKFDPHATYIKKWIPEYDTPAYPQPMIEHRFARERCLETFKRALQD